MSTYKRRTFLKTGSLFAGLFSFSRLSGIAKNARVQMTREVIPLWDSQSANNGVYEQNPPQLEVFIPEAPVKELKKAVIVCPGGGYGMLADHEGQPFAELFAVNRMVGAVLTYRVKPNTWPGPYADACRAVRLLRKYAADFSIDPQQICLMGFSAGGHLAATVGTQPNLYQEPEDDLAGEVEARPDRLVLAYPVVSFDHEYGHEGSFHNLMGDQKSDRWRQALSNENHVTARTPPVFLFHTANDPVVPVANSIRYAEACIKKEVPVALHIYPRGRHGVGMAANLPGLQNWTQVLLDWLNEVPNGNSDYER